MTGSLRQSGGALLIALLAVALAAVLAVSLLETTQRGLARTEALLAMERSHQYALGMEALIRHQARRAQAEGMDLAAMSGAWSEPFEVPGGHVQGRLLDQQGRFNLNALASAEPAISGRAEAQLQRLLEQLGLNPAIAAELADWVVVTPVPRAGSVGDAWYAGRQPPYRRAGLPLLQVSELRWLRSVDETAYQRLRPHVTALPDLAQRINVNSTTAAVLVAMIEALPLDQAQRVLADGPYTDLRQFAAHPALTGLLGPAHEAELVVSSRWHLAQARVMLDGIERDFYRLMALDGSGYDFRYFSQGSP